MTDGGKCNCPAWPSQVEVAKDAAIDWMYPDLGYPGKPGSRLRINMMHVRASNDFTIEYDGERDGFVIRTERVKDTGDEMETVESDVEVAFIPAWLT